MTDIADDVDGTATTGFDLDGVTATERDEPARPRALYDPNDLRRVLTDPALMPPGVEVEPLGAGDHKLSLAGMDRPIRVTTDAAFYRGHAERAPG